MSATLTSTTRSTSLPRSLSRSLHPPHPPSTNRSSSSPPSTTTPTAPPETPESLLNRYIYTPLLFATFLLSFLLIDTRNHNRTTGRQDRHAAGSDEKSWIWRAKHRKLARMEIGQALGEALDMRRWVVLGVVGGAGVGFVGAWWVGVWLYGGLGRGVGLG